MTCELINPRKDLPEIAAALYRSLKNAPCRCQWRWVDGKYCCVIECAAHMAMARYETIIEVAR